MKVVEKIAANIPDECASAYLIESAAWFAGSRDAMSFEQLIDAIENAVNLECITKSDAMRILEALDIAE